MRASPRLHQSAGFAAWGLLAALAACGLTDARAPTAPPSPAPGHVLLLAPRAAYVFDTVSVQAFVYDTLFVLQPSAAITFSVADTGAARVEATGLQDARLILKAERPFTLRATSEGRQDTLRYIPNTSPHRLRLFELLASRPTFPTYNVFFVNQATAPMVQVVDTVTFESYWTNSAHWTVLSTGTPGQPDTAVVEMGFDTFFEHHTLTPRSGGVFRLRARIGTTVAETTFTVRGGSSLAAPPSLGRY